MPALANDHRRLTGLSNLQPDVDELRVYEARIVIQLDAGDAIYSERLGRLYFFDSGTKRISETISSVLTGVRAPAEIEPVVLDQHRFIAVGRKVAIDETSLVAVSTALKLIGVEVKRRSGDIVRRAGL